MTTNLLNRLNELTVVDLKHLNRTLRLPAGRRGKGGKYRSFRKQELVARVRREGLRRNHAPSDRFNIAFFEDLEDFMEAN